MLYCAVLCCALLCCVVLYNILLLYCVQMREMELMTTSGDPNMELSLKQSQAAQQLLLNPALASLSSLPFPAPSQQLGPALLTSLAPQSAGQAFVSSAFQPAITSLSSSSSGELAMATDR